MKQVKPGILRLSAYAPRAYWTGDIREVGRRPDAALRVLEGAGPGTVAVVERAPPEFRAKQPATTPAVAAEVVSSSRNALSLRVRAPERGIVVVNEAFYPGWTATVDGKPARIVPANHAFRGVLVDAGTHRIEMHYRALGYRILGSLSVLGFLAIAGLLLWHRRPATPGDS